MAIDNNKTDCDRCLGGGGLEVCPLCRSSDVGNTGPDGCDHDLPNGTFFDQIQCPDCDGTGDREVLE